MLNFEFWRLTCEQFVGFTRTNLRTSLLHRARCVTKLTHKNKNVPWVGWVSKTFKNKNVSWVGCHYIYKYKVDLCIVFGAQGIFRNDIVVIRKIICSGITIDQTRDVAWIKNILFDIFRLFPRISKICENLKVMEGNWWSDVLSSRQILYSEEEKSSSISSAHWTENS